MAVPLIVYLLFQKWKGQWEENKSTTLSLEPQKCGWKLQINLLISLVMYRRTWSALYSASVNWGYNTAWKSLQGLRTEISWEQAASAPIDWVSKAGSSSECQTRDESSSYFAAPETVRHPHIKVLLCRSLDNFWVSVLCLHWEGPRALTQVARLSVRCLYLLSHLVCLRSASCFSSWYLGSHLSTESHDYSTQPSLQAGSLVGESDLSSMVPSSPQWPGSSLYLYPNPISLVPEAEGQWS